MEEGSSRLPRDRFFVPNGGPIDQALGRTTHLGIVAHADDLEILAYHGILTCYREPSLAFSGVVVTDGVGSVRTGPFARLSPEEFTRVRREEQERAAVLGEYSSVAFLGRTSAETRNLGNTDVDEELRELVQSVQPRVLYTHSLFDRHESHLAVTLRTVRALRTLPEEMRPEAVFGVEVWGDLDWLPAALRVRLDVSGEPRLEEALLSAFDSQIAAKRYDRGTVGRRLAHATFAESHAADAADRISLAMDLTPLLEGSADPLSYAEQILASFRAETRARLERLLASG